MGEESKMSSCKLSEDVQINYESVQSVINEDLCIRHVPVEFVPKLLQASYANETRISVAQNVDCIENDENILKSV